MDDQYKDLADQYAGKEDGYYEQDRPEMLAFVPESSRFILEVGCSSGMFGGAIRRTRKDTVVWGIEPSAEAAKIAGDNLNNVICGTFEPQMAQLEEQKFDCIVFNDVLEHLPNPERALLVAREYLSENGVVVASITNVLHFYNVWQVLTQQDWKYEDSGIMDSTHLRFFTKKSIIRMFETCGFQITEIEGINPSYGIKYKIANALTLGKLADLKYIQFAVQARP